MLAIKGKTAHATDAACWNKDGKQRLESALACTYLPYILNLGYLHMLRFSLKQYTFPAKNRVQQLCIWSILTPQVLWKGQCRAWRRAFWDSVSCRKYTNVNNCVVHGLSAKTYCFSKSERYFSKSLCPDLVPLHCDFIHPWLDLWPCPFRYPGHKLQFLCTS